MKEVCSECKGHGVRVVAIINDTHFRYPPNPKNPFEITRALPVAVTCGACVGSGVKG